MAPMGAGSGGAGVVLQCARVDRMPQRLVNDGTVQGVCGDCRQRVWLCKEAKRLAGTTTGLKPVCDVCRPAKQVGPITPGK